MLYVLFRYLHLFAAVVFAGALIVENLAIKPVINQQDAHNLARVDAVCGMAVLTMLGCGLSLWLWVGKPADFYSANPVFHAKLGLFTLLVSSAIYPAVFFIRHRRTQLTEIAVPRAVQLLLRLELVLLACIPLLAWAMARGIGLPS